VGALDVAIIRVATHCCRKHMHETEIGSTTQHCMFTPDLLRANKLRVTGKFLSGTLSPG
jgi:hypothetical protein